MKNIISIWYLFSNECINHEDSHAMDVVDGVVVWQRTRRS